MRQRRDSGDRPDRAVSFGIVVHGGVGSSTRLAGPCAFACAKAFAMLEAGVDALEAVVEAVRLLEDDGRFNAGRGSTIWLDGRTVEMDASVMDSQGRLGSVMAVRDVKNPILAALAVSGTPHVALAGQGATLFARRAGIGPSPESSEKARKGYEKTLRLIREGGIRKKDARWKGADLERLWNFELPYGQAILPDTVGAVAKDKAGHFAVAGSTGGASPMMLGRVGDTAILGSGFFAGPHGAIAATGIGEAIIRKTLAKAIYDLIQEGKEAKRACGEGIRMFPPNVPVGIIAITSAGFAIAANKRMAASSLTRKA